MKITGPGPIHSPASRRAAKAGGETEESFASRLGPGAEPPAALAGAQPLANVQALLALQEVPDALQARKRALKRSHDLLDRLDEIRHALLEGTLSVETLHHLALQLRERRPAGIEPGVAAVLDEIELRVAVELAKLGH